MDNQTVEMLQKKIKFWTQTLNNSRNDVERAVLSGKIKEAKDEIERITGKEFEKVVKVQMDAPLMVEKEDRKNGVMTRGQVIDTGGTISFTL